jgi:hypothetical protein
MSIYISVILASLDYPSRARDAEKQEKRSGEMSSLSRLGRAEMLYRPSLRLPYDCWFVALNCKSQNYFSSQCVNLHWHLRITEDAGGSGIRIQLIDLVHFCGPKHAPCSEYSGSILITKVKKYIYK